MSNAFDGATAFNQPLDAWDVSNVVHANSMFRNAVSFNQDLSSWRPERFLESSNMFRGATNFSQDLCSWGGKFRMEFGTPNFISAFVETNCPIQQLQQVDVNAEPPGPFCFDCGTPIAPTTVASVEWSTREKEGCTVDGNCIQSHEGVGEEAYESARFCNFITNVPGTLMVEVFGTECYFDSVYLQQPNSTTYFATSGLTELTELDTNALHGLAVGAGTFITWIPDAYKGSAGFRICLETQS